MCIGIYKCKNILYFLSVKMAKFDLTKDDEDYWNSSEKHSFSFDQNTEVKYYEYFIYCYVVLLLY